VTEPYDITTRVIESDENAHTQNDNNRLLEDTRRKVEKGGTLMSALYSKAGKKGKPQLKTRDGQRDDLVRQSFVSRLTSVNFSLVPQDKPAAAIGSHIPVNRYKARIIRGSRD
jgi:hypothetical protein